MIGPIMSERSVSETTTGVLACLGAATAWGANGVASKYLMNMGLSPFVLSQGRLTIASVLTLIWLAITRVEALRIEKRHIWHFALLGVVGMAGVNVCYFEAISKIATAAAILVEYIAPVLIAVYARLFMAQRMGPMRWVALCLALVGCYFVVGGYNINLLHMNSAGFFWGLGAAFTYSFYIIYSEYLLRVYSPWTILLYALIFGALSWNAVLGPGTLPTMGWDAASWTLIFLCSSLGTIVPFGLFAWGVELLRSTRATIVATFEPISAGLIAFLFLGERLAFLQMVGGAAVIVSVILIQREKELDEFSPSVLKQQGTPRAFGIRQHE